MHVLAMTSPDAEGEVVVIGPFETAAAAAEFRASSPTIHFPPYTPPRRPQSESRARRPTRFPIWAVVRVVNPQEVS